MPKQMIDFYEVEVHFKMRKKYWDADVGVIDREIIADKLQQGMEVPIEDVEVTIVK